MTMKKPIKVLIMSVEQYETNHTVHYFEKIGGVEHCVVCLPNQFKANASSYKNKGIDVFLYDEKKYINSDFEFFGFKPRNCGGVGRQGIAEAVEKYGDDFLCFQVDDDYTVFSIYDMSRQKSKMIKQWHNLEKLIYAEQEFFENTGIEQMAKTGATITDPSKGFLSNKKIFNNFIMRKGNELNFFGFAALCSDDQRYNIYQNLLRLTPMLSTNCAKIEFYKNQGDRNDGNAVLYNSDCSWKKSFSLKMMMPQAISQYIKKESNRVLFREHIRCKFLYPPIFLEKEGKLVAKI